MKTKPEKSEILTHKPFKARSVNYQALYGNKPMGIPQIIVKPSTKF